MRRSTPSRRERPDDGIDDIVALIVDRMGSDGELALAAKSLPESGDADVIGWFVYEMEESDLDGIEDDDVNLEDDEI